MEVAQKLFQKMEMNKVALPVQSIWSSSGQFEKQFVKGKLRNTLNISARLPSPSPSPPSFGQHLRLIQDTSSRSVCLKLNHLKRVFLKVKKKQKAYINMKGRGIILSAGAKKESERNQSCPGQQKDREKESITL